MVSITAAYYFYIELNVFGSMYILVSCMLLYVYYKAYYIYYNLINRMHVPVSLIYIYYSSEISDNNITV